MGTSCALLQADLFLFSYEAGFIQSVLSTRMKQNLSLVSPTDTSMMYLLSINNRDLENHLGQMYPVYSCRSGGTVSFALSFTTIVAISTSISQILRSCVAIFNIRPPLAILSHSICQGLLLL